MIINVNNSINKKGRKFASGTVRVSSDTKYFFRSSISTSDSRNYVHVQSDLGFIPSFIFVMFRNLADDCVMTLYKLDGLGKDPNFNVEMNGIAYNLKGNAYVNENGFLLPFVYVIGNAEWYAYE